MQEWEMGLWGTFGAAGERDGVLAGAFGVQGWEMEVSGGAARVAGLGLGTAEVCGVTLKRVPD